MAALIAGCGFTGHAGIQHRLPGSPIGLQVNRIANRVTDEIAVIFLFEQRGPFKAQTNRRELGIGKRARPGGGT